MKKRKIGGNTVFVGQLAMKIFILYFLSAFTLTPSSLIWPEDDKKMEVDCQSRLCYCLLTVLMQSEDEDPRNMKIALVHFFG